MASEGASSFIKPAVRCITVGACSAFAGPLGALTGAFIGGVLGQIIGQAAEKFAENVADKLVEKASESFLNSSADWALDRFKRSRPNLQGVYREAFRQSIAQIHKQYPIDYPEWFANWNICLNSSVELNLQDIQPAQVDVANFDELFRRTMERLNVQGLQAKAGIITVFPDREAPEALLILLKRELPEHFPEIFQRMIVQKELSEAWNELEIGFRVDLTEMISGIAQQLHVIAEDTARLPGMERTLNELAARFTNGADPNCSIGNDSLELDAAFQAAIRNRLASTRTSLVGRERQIEELCGELRREDSRLLTMTGVGGTGKTTLARAVIDRLYPEFSDSVFFVELETIKQAVLVASTIAHSLGVKEIDSKLIVEGLKRHLRERNTLLVLDSFEHLLDAVPILVELLAAAPLLKMLVTSRALLHLRFEREYVVPPLAFPETIAQASLDEIKHCEAVRLFVERARGVKGDFVLTNENARSIAEICKRADGLPLAIELAAARVKVLSPQAILPLLDHRLKLLTGGARDLPTRQQTMRGTIDWSYELLTEDEKQLFSRLAVFAGGFTFEVAERVLVNQLSVAVNGELTRKESTSVPEPTIEVLDDITSLADNSLLVAKPLTRGDVRFRMLEVVREYALECLAASGEAEPLLRQYAAYFLAFAEKAELRLQGAQSAEWLGRLEEEHDNIRAALQWSLTNHAATAARLGAAISYLWEFQGYLTEGLTVSKEILSLGDQVPTRIRWKLLSAGGNLARFQGDHETAQRMYEEGLTDAGSAHDLPQISLFSRGLGKLAYVQGDCTKARRFTEEALTAARESNDQFGIACSLNMLGDLTRLQSNDSAARALYQEALALCKQSGNKYKTAEILINLAAAEYGEGAHRAAYSHFVEGLKMASESGDKIVGHKITISYSLDGLAALGVMRGETELAAKLAGAAERLRESINYQMEPAERRFRDTYLSSLRTMLSEGDFFGAYEQGGQLKLEECVALALTENAE